MKIKNIFWIVLLSIFFNYSCSNGKVDSKTLNKIEKVEIVDTVADILLPKSTHNSDTPLINKDISSISVKFKRVDEFVVLKGRVKSMKEIRYQAQLVNGYVVPETLSQRGEFFMGFSEDGQPIKNSLNAHLGNCHYEFQDFDSVGNVTLIFRHCGYKHDVVEFIINKYAEKSRIVRQNTYNFDSKDLSSYSIYHYDDSNNSSIRKEYDQNNRIVFKSHWHSDSLGNIVSVTWYNYVNDTISSEARSTFSYVYDSFNNWTVCYENKGLDDYFVTYRYFTYYE